MIIVTGTGWSGSTVFLKLLRGLGYTITPEGEGNQSYEVLKGEELVNKMIKGEVPWPDAVKHLGGMCFNLHEWVDKCGWDVDHVFLLVRPLENALAKRKAVGGMTRKSLVPPLSGEAYKALSPEQLDEATRNTLRATVGAAIHQLVERDYPFTVVNFPRFTTDRDYCWMSLAPLYNNEQCGWDIERFEAVWDAIMDPWFVHLSYHQYLDDLCHRAPPSTQEEV